MKNKNEMMERGESGENESKQRFLRFCFLTDTFIVKKEAMSRRIEFMLIYLFRTIDLQILKNNKIINFM